MTIQDIISKFTHKSDRVKEILEERRAEKLAIQRDKNSNERELERFQEENRQKRIKFELEKYRKIKNKEDNHSHLLNKQKNIIKQKPLFNSKSVILNEKRSFLK
jgi:hypothetical protein